MKHYAENEAEDFFDMGEAWLKIKNYEKAEECLKKSIEMNPNFIYAYILLAETSGKEKKFGDAYHILKRASRLDPEFDRLYYLMAKFALRSGDTVKFRRSIEKAIEMNPEPLYLRIQEIFS
jgi:tetratricopeptide (TPR) repeat protein